ncbi:MAG TPA: plastocyanin/azurin family copper-binding protein [Longimicrobium sp.]|jgi:plastocyanin|nr:plastocyanin/azurin family copper-binding protein [Longimicrobium sp.]
MTTNKLPLLGLVALLAACGGGNDRPATTTTDTTTAAAAPATPAPAVAPAPAPAVAQGNVVEVHMVTTPDGASGRYEPANVTVKKGDTVRFITDGKTVHNVSFPPADNPGKTNLPPSPGPYLTTPNQNYDVVANMDPGTYNFHCDPHFATGMKGVLTVQ